MKDTSFTCYIERFVCLEGKIKDGQLYMDSEVWGDEYDSEKHYRLTKEDTEKLFSEMTLDQFIEFCRKERTLGMEALFKALELDVWSMTI